MNTIEERIARRFKAELLTKQWLMGVRRGWLSLLKVKPHGWDGIMKAFDHLRSFVDNLEDQVFYVRRGPYTSVPSMTESQKAKDAFKAVREAISDATRRARHWMEAELDPKFIGRGTFSVEEGAKMRKLYEEKFGDLLTTYVPTRGLNQHREANITELLDKLLEILRADAARLEQTIQTEKGMGLDVTKQVFEEPAFKEFSLGNMKIVVTDPKGNGHRIRPYIRMLDIAHTLTTKKGFGNLWYGVLLIQSTDFNNLSDWDKANYEKAGYKDLQSTAGMFHSGRDVVSITAPADDRLIGTVIHELGHRYWFKRMSSEQRARFEGYLQEGVLPVSEYGKTNAVEAFAEAFMWYCVGRDMNRDQIESFRAVLASEVLLMAPSLREPCAYNYSRSSQSG